MRGTSSFIAAAAAFIATTIASASPPAPSVNGVAADMTLDAARAAATPTSSWSQVPPPDALSRHYPARALQLGVEARVVADCRVADDLSLVCLSYDVTPPEHHAMFARAAQEIVAYYRTAPKLKDGSDARGAAVRVPILFKLEP